jgi:hypothetical protein
MKDSFLISTMMALSLLGANGSAANLTKQNVSPWREWCILTTEEDVTAPALAFSPNP